MGWFSKDPEVKAAEQRLHAQHDRDAAKLRAGDPSATRLNEKLQQRVAAAERRAKR